MVGAGARSRSRVDKEWKLQTGKPFAITKIGARIMSIITVGGHEVTRKLNEPSDQTIMHIDVYGHEVTRNLNEPSDQTIMHIYSREVAASQSVLKTDEQQLMVRMR